jgi:hypothetical protein
MQDIFFVLYLLFFVGLLALMVMVSDHWWEPWPAVRFLSPICRYSNALGDAQDEGCVYVHLYATEPPPGSSGQSYNQPVGI